MLSYFEFVMLVASAEQLGWDYKWPYNANHTCACTQVPALGDFFESEEECLQAYSEDEYQWCLFNGQGVTDSQCDEAVAIAEGVTNEKCGEQCTGVVAGVSSLDEFETGCKFNFYADFGDEVAVGWTSCFSNMVYGWSDYDPNSSVQKAPLKIFQSVESPTACQSLCQAVTDCVYWTWRAYLDSPAEASASTAAFQNEALTCLLYDQEYIDGVLQTDVPTSSAFAVPTAYCNVEAIPDCLVDPFGRSEVDYFEPYACLMCDCVSKCAWKSPYHLSGPAFCDPEYRNECSYKRPAWTSTMPPCETETPSTVSETTIELEESLTTTTGIALETTFPPTDTMGTSTTVLATSTMAATMGTATTTRSSCPECDECEDDCDEPEVYLDCDEPCEDCLTEDTRQE
eukprot:Gregarina_sp_Pseudo_9__5916@NODE_940_length_2045_cov_335_887338_g882_i0_p1_GENE_NODE_940_length_2045_cov_335_887338_g882_i0NODE_940_length_2045_cov_335_887338_g882_i0_p1_ORF_typecomplete_len399_score27_17PAN_4/PF14295_6/1_6e03PAN_4/PF14295_6/5_5e03PAN_4/PF14295_6/1_8e06PAN_4/PF14295_6/1_8e04PAN_4/PF14295_6/1_5e04_NODE_940_length_2045_cov_335_887338_g882_i07191915